MSWPPPYPLPPRRSRSRSPPPRGGGGGSYSSSRSSYADVPYQQDPYRAEWDSYDRDKAWASYERDRAVYDYGRRPRSRSPPPDELSRKRRRSLSPYERDRYDPRPRYSDDYDTHSRGYDYTSPRRGPPSFPPSRRAPADPHTFDYPASLKQYADWFRYFHPTQATEEDAADKLAEQEAGDGSKPRNGIKAKWEKYKKDFASSQLQTMFEHHRKSPWFAEKYDPVPEMQQLRTRVRKEGWRGHLSTFLLELETGKYDPDLSEPVSEPEPVTSPVVKEEGTATNGTETSSAPTVTDDAPPEDVKPNDDDGMQFTMDTEEEGNDATARNDTNGKPTFGDLKRNVNRGEEMSVMPDGNQVMIRTIPPDIGRVKLEESCASVPGFIYLALGDPLQKRNYYRAGWMKFEDDADMSTVMTELSEKKIEGFKLHVTHNVRPFVNRIRYAPEVASKPDRMEKDLANAKILVSILEDEAAELRVLKVRKRKETVGDAPTTTAVDAADASNPATGDDDVPMADVPPREEEDEEEEPEPTEKGSDAVERRIEKTMAEWREQNPTAEEKAFAVKKTVISLDLYLDYLRNAFHTCYYCCLVTDHVEELQRKCLKHERKPLSPALLEEIKAAEAADAERLEREKEMEVAGNTDDTADKDTAADKTKDRTAKPGDSRDWKRNDERWIEWLDQKIALLINRNGVDPREYGGKSYDDELTKAVEPFIKQEDEGKFRCKTCQKLFKATSFVEKHIANKHAELVKYLEDIPYFNNFALDPHRIQPFAHPPPAVGNGQPPPPQAFGIQAPHGLMNDHGGRPNDYGRGGGFQGGVYGNAPYSSNGHWDGPSSFPLGYGGPPPSGYPLPPRRDESARRLSDRLGGFANDNGPGFGAGLPAKPTPAALDSALVAGNSQNNGTRRATGGRIAGGAMPPPPPDAKEDPRAAAGKRVSYHDMDEVAEGDIELTY